MNRYSKRDTDFDAGAMLRTPNIDRCPPVLTACCCNESWFCVARFTPFQYPQKGDYSNRKQRALTDSSSSSSSSHHTTRKTMSRWTTFGWDLSEATAFYTLVK